MKLLFLDIDGVLNDHTRLPNGLSTIQPDKARHLNRILETVPDLQLVISSAWRYYIHNGYMSPAGFEMMLQTHGIHCRSRIHGITGPDPETFIPGDHEAPFDEAYWHARGLKWRADQISCYWAEHGNNCRSVALDDLSLSLVCPRLVKTERTIGLTSELADECIRRLFL